MAQKAPSLLEAREVFHLEFLRQLAKKLKPNTYALKGGVNMRLFFHSPRYSEDMDLDVQGIGVQSLKEISTAILGSSTFKDGLRPFGIKEVLPPDMSKAKQTETTQRFKVHLTIGGDVDLPTKIEFSRRGFGLGTVTESLPEEVLRGYRLPPLICTHYDADAAWLQKIRALADRPATQARDVFDLYILGTQTKDEKIKPSGISVETIKKAVSSAFSIEFNQFRDTVLAYLNEEDRRLYDTPDRWDEIRLTVTQRLEAL